MNAIIALYGNVALAKGYCEGCAGDVFLSDDGLACAHDVVGGVTITGVHRFSITPGQRRRPSSTAQAQILKSQRMRCFWCDHVFYSHFTLGGGVAQYLRLEWDHVIPYSYDQDNQAENFVASCHLCNRIKFNYFFDSIADCRQYIEREWKRHGYKVTQEAKVSYKVSDVQRPVYA